MDSQTVDAAAADLVYDAVRRAVAGHQITAATVMVVLTATMSEAERVRGLTGAQKKALVIHVVNRLVEELPVGADDKTAIKAAVSLLLPAVIDTVVGAANGGFGFGRPAAGAGAGAGCAGCALF